MSKAIWRYSIKPVVYSQRLEIPRGGKILSVQYQDEKIALWVLVDPEEAKEGRIFNVHLTGPPIEKEDLGNFLGTVPFGAYVVHVFEEADE